MRFMIAVAATALLTGCATNMGMLGDASATCGNPTVLLPASRSYQEPTTVARTNDIYNCMQNYLNKSPEYQSVGGHTADSRYIEAMRQIDLARAAGKMTAAEAKIAATQLHRDYAAGRDNF